jgi:hypothetical protein
MTQGVVLFAFNNDVIDYILIAKEAARRIKLYLGKPVALITDSKKWAEKIDQESKVFDYIIDLWDGDHEDIAPLLNEKNLRRYKDGSLTQKRLSFKNNLRTKIYELSPFDETLVIDSDYMLANDNLKYCWHQPLDFLIYKDSTDLAGFRDTYEFKKISDYTIDFYWATVFFFRKTPECKIFFDLVDHVRENWSYYKLVYQFETKMYRNDHAFSIALHIMNGYTQSNWAGILPGRMVYTIDADLLVEMSDSSFLFLLEKEKYHGEYTLQRINDVSVHIMNKFTLKRVINGDSI